MQQTANKKAEPKLMSSALFIWCPTPRGIQAFAIEPPTGDRDRTACEAPDINTSYAEILQIPNN
jgi:hypothetical protein